MSYMYYPLTAHLHICSLSLYSTGAGQRPRHGARVMTPTAWRVSCVREPTSCDVPFLDATTWEAHSRCWEAPAWEATPWDYMVLQAWTREDTI